ncbi:uncharacterized protein LOC144355656 [Saccoglossus kowalevskii]
MFDRQEDDNNNSVIAMTRTSRTGIRRCGRKRRHHVTPQFISSRRLARCGGSLPIQGLVYPDAWTTRRLLRMEREINKPGTNTVSFTFHNQTPEHSTVANKPHETPGVCQSGRGQARNDRCNASSPNKDSPRLSKVAERKNSNSKTKTVKRTLRQTQIRTRSTIELGNNSVDVVKRRKTFENKTAKATLQRILQLQKDNCLTNVVLRCKGKHIYCHSVILISQSEALRRALDNANQDEDGNKVIDIDMCDIHILETIVDYLYGKEINVQHRQLHAVLDGAKKFEVVSLITELEHLQDNTRSVEFILKSRE